VTGTFIAFEGGDASGKSTQARRVADALGAVFTREPGGTPLSEALRALLLDPAQHVALRTEALLMAASRAQLVHDVVAPTLASGRHVVTDRFLGSSLAYQGYGRGLDVEAVRGLSLFAVEGTLPDLTVLIDVPVSLAMGRLGEDLDRIEREEQAFHERVRAGYLELAAADPGGWVVIDGVGDVDTVASRVDAALAARLSVVDGIIES
jgi:dTMP kinase